jgi:hypothetical protein
MTDADTPAAAEPITDDYLRQLRLMVEDGVSGYSHQCVASLVAEIDRLREQVQFLGGQLQASALPHTGVAREIGALRTELEAIAAERDELRKRVNPATWTAPDGTALDLSRQIFDRDGDAWQLDEVPPLTVAMVDGDLSPKTLPHLWDLLGPLTNDGVEV